ncbi:MAG TPA: chemotaxis protein CheB [Methanospirillum sp.]|nr:chemotaxis protein CheB [Methanospirillum sp.]
MIKVLIIDDSLFIRTVVQDMLSDDPDIQVVGVATDGVEALEKIKELRPDLITLDIEMPRLDGIAVLERRREFPSFPKTLVLSSLTSEGAEMTKRAIAGGADDFMLKPRGIKNIREIGGELKQKIKNICTIAYVTTKPSARDEIARNIVLIGSSAGGPPMLDVIVSNLPADLNAAVIITQHMPKGGFTAALAARLNRISPLIIKETESGDILKRGTVFVSMAGFHTVISSYLDKSGVQGGKIVHADSPPMHNVKPAVDKTFISAAQVFGARSVSAILSGMGNDGGEGSEAIRKAGGVTIVCRQEDCLVYGMARSAISRDAAMHVLALKAIPAKIEDLVKSLAG